MIFRRYLLSSTACFAPPGEGGGGGGAGDGGGDGKGAGDGKGGDGGKGGAGDGGKGGGGDPWYLSKELPVDEDTRKFLQGKNYPDVATALKSGREADTVARSRNVMDRPDPKNVEGWKGWPELGWAERIEDYKLTPPKLADGIERDTAGEEAFRKVAHAAKVPVAQAQKILDGLTAHNNEVLKGLETEGTKRQQTLDTALKKDWGKDYDANLDLATRAAKFVGIGLDDSKELEEILGSPAFLKVFHKIGTQLGEDTLKGGGGGGGQMSSAQAKAERLRLEGDPTWMNVFRDSRNPRNKEYKDQREALLKIEAGEKRP